MPGARTRLQAAAEAGCSEGSTSCGKSKVQTALAKQKVEIDQIEPEQSVSARDRDGLGDVFVRFRN
jgi:hypothetical protein